MKNQSTPPKDPLEAFAWYLDQAFRIPGTRFRVGWDGIIGLVPGIGETIMVIAQAGLVIIAVAKHDVPPVIAMRMILNVLIDSLVGAIPFLGDIFDFAFKANTRNIELLRQVKSQKAAGKKVSTARHYGFLITIVLVLLGVVVGAIFLIFKVLNFVILQLQESSWQV